MRFAFFCLTAILCSFFTLKGQNLSGTIVDNNGKGVDYATITLKKYNDSSFVTGTITDEYGNYRIEGIKKGNYLVMVSMVGYKTSFSDKIVVSNQNVVQNLKLEEETKLLGEIQIQARKPVIEQQAGKIVMNVENSIVSQGLMAIELLKRAPGVQVDNDGNITLKGKENVLLMIDGKPTYLSAKQAAAILKSLPSNQIANIEVMTTPPAKYDAEGNAGVININLKKGAMQGFNGSTHASLGHGILPKSNIGISLSSGIKRWTLGASYDFTANEDFNVYQQSRNFGSVASGNKYTLIQRYNVPFYSNSYGLNIGFQATPKLSFAVSHRGILSSDVYYGNNLEGKVTDKAGNVTQRLVTRDHNPDRFYNFNQGMDIKYKFDSLGHELSGNAEYGIYQQRSTQTTSSQFFVNETLVNTANWDGRLPTNVYNRNFKIDYTLPISNKIKLEAGIKRIDIDIESNIDFKSSQTGSLVLNLPSSNNLIFQENISAAYASFDLKQAKFSGTLGLRTEYWNALGRLPKTGETFKRDSIVPFPTVNIKYDIAKNHQIQLSYNRRIDRPSYNSLNPISYFTDPYTVFRGNSSLRPQLAENFELSHNFLEGALITTLNYSDISNYIAEYVLVPNADSTKPQTMTSINIPRYRNMGISVSLYIPVTKFWTCQLFANGFQNTYNGSLFGAELNQKLWAYTANTSQMFTLPKDWSIEISGTYLSPTLDGYTRLREMGMLSFGIQKDILHSNATIKLAGQDVFYSFIYNIETNFEGLASKSSYRWDNRIFTLSFNYKFGRNRFKGEEDKKEEMQRSGGRL